MAKFHDALETSDQPKVNGADAPIETLAVPVFKPTKMFYAAMSMLGVLTLTVALDATALAVALPIIAKELEGTSLQAFWTSTGYLLTGAVFQPVVGGISTLFGRLEILTISIVLFLAGCLGSALANNLTTMLILRAVQGAGGGGVVVMSEILVCDMVPLRQRGEWFGMLSGVYAIGTVLGPIVGGLFAQHVTWRWIFYINLPFIGISLALVPFAVKYKKQTEPLAARLKRVDYVGSLLAIGSATAFILGISWGGVQYSWSAYQTILPIVLGVVGSVGFFFYEEYVPAEPIVPTKVFKNLNCSASYVNTIIHSIVVLCLVFYLPLYYQGVKGYNTTITGVALFPETFTVAPAAVIIGIAIGKVGKFMWAVWSGWLLSVLGLGVMWLLDVDTTVVQWVFLNLTVGVGTGFLYPAHQFSIQAATEDRYLAPAVSMWSFFRTVGQALGVAIGGVILQNQLQDNISSYPPVAENATAYSHEASSLAAALRLMSPSQGRSDLKQAYADSLKVVWVTLCGIAALGFCISLLVKDYPLDRFLPADTPKTDPASVSGSSSDVDLTEKQVVVPDGVSKMV
ncbi:hypothetical protein LTS08_004578 [Lithohypha guttulata]|nr:hypothetical protein LTS08_004578 [Lithohypha guttulata]